MLPSAALAACLVAMVCIFMPLAIYAGHPEEFQAPLAALMLAVLLPGLMLVLAVALLAGFLPSSAAARLQAVLAALTLLCWLQGTFLVWDYGVLDGSPIAWTDGVWRGVFDSLLWTVGLLLAVYGSGRLMVRLRAAALIAAGIQALASGVLLAGLADDMAEPGAPAFDASQYEAMFGFSPTGNVLHIVMDGFQSDVFADIIGDPAGGAVREALRGFTFFAGNTGSYPYTQMTMPLLVSGRRYRNEMPVEEFVADVMQGPTILNLAAASGFDVDIASQPALARIYASGARTNTWPIPLDLHTDETDYVAGDLARLLDLSLFRVVPHFAKAYVYQDELWFLQRFSRDASFVNLRYFAEIEFLDRLRKRMNTRRDRPVYKLFHLMLSHRPTAGTADCRFDGIKPTSRHNVTEQSRCALSRVIAVLDRMKELGIYDDAVVVLMADHGAWVGARGYQRSAQDGGGPKSTTAGMAVPLLAIKPGGARGDLDVSLAPATVGDVPATIAGLLGLAHTMPGKNVFDLAEDEQRTRHFYNYAYGDNHKRPGYLYAMLEYRISGDPFDARSWQQGRRFPPGGVTQ